MDYGFGGLETIICGASFTWGNRGIIDKLEEVLSVTSDNSKLLAVFAESIELVGVGRLQLLTSDIGELGFGDEGLGFGTDKFLFKNYNLGGVGLLVLELCDLVGDLLFA